MGAANQAALQGWADNIEAVLSDLAAANDLVTSLQSDVADLTARLAAAQAIIDQDATAIADLTSQLAAAEQTITEQAARIQELEDELDPKVTLWGASVVPKTGETLAAALARENTALRLDVVRVYDAAKGPAQAWTTAKTLGAPTRPSVIGFRIPPATVLAGSRDAELTTTFAALPGNCWWTYEAECDRHVDSGEYTATTFITAWRHVYALAAAANCQGKATLMPTGYLFAQRIDPVWPGDDVVDCLAIDPYGHPGDTYQSRLGVVADYAAAHGVTWGVGETGWDPAQGGQAGVQTWVQILAQANGKADFVCWWENGGPPDYRISDKPDTAAMFKAIPRG